MDPLAYLGEAEELGLFVPPSPPEPPAVKGHCRYCGKPVRRGIWLHEKSCKDRK